MIDERLLSLLKDLVAIRSENPPGLEKEVINYLQNFIESFGIETILCPTGLEGRFTLLAFLPGQSSEGIIFTGHSDVVTVSAAERERWLTDPFVPVVKDNYLYGRGSCDMKSGLAAAVLAFCDIAASKIKPAKSLALVITVDEEDSMFGSRSVSNHPLLKEYKSVVVCEPTSLKLCTKSRGRTYGVVTCQGQTAHGSRPEAGLNAILLANDFINELIKEDLSRFENQYGSSHIRPLGIYAGVDPWVVPDICQIKVDARLTLHHYPEDIWQRIDKIIEKCENKYPSLAKINYEIIDQREPWECRDASSFLIKTIKEILSSKNMDSADYCFTGTTDGTPLRRAKREAIIIGPGDLSCAHQENERVSLDELQMAYEIYKDLMLS